MTISRLGGRAMGLIAVLASGLLLAGCGEDRLETAPGASPVGSGPNTTAPGATTPGNTAPAAPPPVTSSPGSTPPKGTEAWLGGGSRTPPSSSVEAPPPESAPPSGDFDAPVETPTEEPAPPVGPNRAPDIAGQPSTNLTAGVAWSFMPVASDPDGDKLTFSVTNKPAWASFDSTTGRLSGTPQAEHQGSYNNIVITVSDGLTTASLAPFSLLVAAKTPGSAVLTWTPPTSNTDGTAVSNLAGYKIYYGTDPENLSNTVQVAGASITTYTVGNLTPGTYYFSIAAYTSDGVEGERSPVGSKTIT